MPKYCVHFGCRLTVDYFVEADTKSDAIEKAQKQFYDEPYENMDCASTDVDVWEEQE